MIFGLEMQRLDLSKLGSVEKTSGSKQIAARKSYMKALLNDHPRASPVATK
jgi:hypothetical protein